MYKMVRKSSDRYVKKRWRPDIQLFDDIVAEHGSDVWWEKEEKDLLSPSHAAEARRHA